MTLRPGVYLQDRYEIIDQIGSGGMSTVYKAKCHKLNRLVAIKVLKEEFSSDSNFVSKFKMEAQAAAGLAHPNIVSVYDVVDEGSLHYIVMELIEGITLKTYIASKGYLEIKESIGIAIQVAQGIAAAHEQHIIHRDIKPQNMIISKDGKVKVADFGIARAVSAQTMSSAAMGSVHYISPEQARGGFSDERSDIYSLGITMYEMVTGRVPFQGETTVAIALAHLEDAIVPPSVYNPEIPISLERIILKCTEKKPDRRYASAMEVIADLRRILAEPEEEYVRGMADYARTVPAVPVDITEGATVPLSGRELAQIKEATRDEEHAGSQEPVVDVMPARRPAWRRMTEAERRFHREEDDGANVQLERLLAVVGIVAAVIIVIVLFVVVSHLSGLFQSSSGLFGSHASQETENGVDTETLADTEVYMPDVVDLSEDLAEAKLKESNLNMKRSYAFYDDIEKGMVAEQDPEAGEIVSRWSSVNVVISNGTDKIDLSALGIGEMEATDAQLLLENKQLTVAIVEEESDTVASGQVIRYEPELAVEGDTVTLYVSTGPHVDLVAVPVIVGQTEEEAIAMLAEAGLTPGDTATEVSDTVEVGVIISQSGGENGMIEPGGQVSYVVSSGPATTTTQRYVASINDVYDFSNLIGPGAKSSTFTVMVRLHQKDSDGSDIYKELMSTRTIVGDVLLPISYTSIESMNGTDEGEVEVVDVKSGAVLKTYQLTFFAMD